MAVLRGDVREVLAPDRRGVEVGEATAEVAGQDLLPLAGIHRRTVRGDGDDGVVGTEAEQLCRCDRGEHVADRREAEVAKRVQHLLRHSTAVGEVAEPIVAGEHHLELVGRTVADGDDDVGVHHVVDQAGCACRRCPGCCARRTRWRASSGTPAPRRRRSGRRIRPSAGRRRRSSPPIRSPTRRRRGAAPDARWRPFRRRGRGPGR